MAEDVTHLVMLKESIVQLEKSIERNTNKLTDMRNTLQRQCFHPTVLIDESYHRGGYDYVSEVIITHKCSICDKILKSYSDPKHKGQYG